MFTALEFLTIIAFPRRRQTKTSRIGRSSAYFPLVGLVLGLILVGVRLAASRFFPREIVNALIILLLFILTRGIHQDGLADTVDGLWGGQDRDAKLRIMKDSAIGAFGVIALVFALLFKFLFLNSIPVKFLDISLVLMLTLSRWTMTLAAFLGKPAQQEGLGHIFMTNTTIKELVIASISALLIAFFLLKFPAIVLIICLVLFAAGFSFLVSRELGGLTGDVLGALAELSELLCLAIIYVLARGGLV